MEFRLSNGFQLADDSNTSHYRKFCDLVKDTDIPPIFDFEEHHDKYVFHLLFSGDNGYYNCNDDYQPIGPMIHDNRNINASFIFVDTNRIKAELIVKENLVSSPSMKLVTSLADKMNGKKPKLVSTSLPMPKKQRTYFIMFDRLAVYMRLLDGGIIKVIDRWNCAESNFYCPILTTGDAKDFRIIRPPPIPGVKIEYIPTPPVDADRLQVGNVYYVDTTGIIYLYADKGDEVLLWDSDGKKWEDTWKKLPARECVCIGRYEGIKYEEEFMLKDDVEECDDESTSHKIPEPPKYKYNLHPSVKHLHPSVKRSYVLFTLIRKIRLARTKPDEAFDTVKIVPSYKNCFGEMKPEQILIRTNEHMSFYPMETIEDQKQKDPEYKEAVDAAFSRLDMPEDLEEYISRGDYEGSSFASINALKKALKRKNDDKSHKKSKKGGFRKYTKKRKQTHKRIYTKRR
jgi:hypothetical protein